MKKTSVLIFNLNVLTRDEPTQTLTDHSVYYNTSNK